MDIFENPQLRIFFQLFLATLLGGIIGLEREYKGKAAGLRTYSLVSLGAALFTILGTQVIEPYFDLNNSGIGIDPSRIIGQIVMGVGFLGAGLIVVRESKVEGLTTAAGLWVAAAMGASVGVNLIEIAVFVTFLTLGIFAGLRIWEERIIHKSQLDNKE